MDEKLQQIIERIKQERRMKNLSQKFVADHLGIPQSSYNKIENGHSELTVKRLFEICRILGIEPAEILIPDELLEKTRCSEIDDLREHYITVLNVRKQLNTDAICINETALQLLDEYRRLYNDLKAKIENN